MDRLYFEKDIIINKFEQSLASTESKVVSEIDKLKHKRMFDFIEYYKNKGKNIRWRETQIAPLPTGVSDPVTEKSSIGSMVVDNSPLSSGSTTPTPSVYNTPVASAYSTPLPSVQSSPIVSESSPYGSIWDWKI